MKSQMAAPLAIVISGVAGSGKSTLGRAVARHLGSPLLDLDSITNPLLDALFGVDNPDTPHWLAVEPTIGVRNARYAALRTVAHDQIETARNVVLVAPFTGELQGGVEWDQLVDALHPARVEVFHLTGEPTVFESRRAKRAIERDLHRDNTSQSGDPQVPHHLLDAELSVVQQAHRVLLHLGIRRNLDSQHQLFEQRFDAVLFDLDGTLVDSTASVNRSWRRFAEHYGVSAQKLAENHGKTAKNLVEILLPSELQDEGLELITDLEVKDAVGLRPVPGAHKFFHALDPDRRAVVTSGSIPIATARLTTANFTIPEVTVTANHVSRGKPDPEPFLTAARKLGVSPERCLVFEDAPAGITAARKAGCSVVALSGTVTDAELADADIIIDGFDQLAIDSSSGQVRLVLTKS